MTHLSTVLFRGPTLRLRHGLILLLALPAILSAQQSSGGPPPPRPRAAGAAAIPELPASPARPAPRLRGLLPDTPGFAPLHAEFADQLHFDTELFGQLARTQQQLGADRALMLADQARLVGELAAQSSSALYSQPRLAPPAPWAQDDPADSLYRVAREALNRGEYRRAANAFRDIPARFASSRYAVDAIYWQAFALYRIGGTDDLRAARELLETQTTRAPSARTQTDATALSTRILGALASRGDAAAQQALRERTANNVESSCDQEDQSVRGEALSAVVRSNGDQAATTLRAVLQKRDVCSAQLRLRAVSLLGGLDDVASNGSAELLTDVVRNDPSVDVRASAMNWLMRMPGEQSLPMIEEVLRTSADEQMQAAAVSALARSTAPRARQAIRTVIERNDAPRSVRLVAIASYSNSARASDEDDAYLRSVYARLTDARLKSTVVQTLARRGGAANTQWLTSIVQNASEPMESRIVAISSVNNAQTPVASIAQLYDALSERQLREQLVSSLGRRTEPEATDKLLDIARTGTDPNLRRLAISALSRKNDPRTTRLLLEIINK